MNIQKKFHEINEFVITIEGLRGCAQKALRPFSESMCLYSFNNMKTFDNVFHYNCDNKPLNDKSKLDIVTISFNNDKVITQQIRLLSKYMLDPYYYTVADNSSDPLKQEKIMQICQKYDVSYIKLPKNPYNGKNPSKSHGFALQWVFNNYIKYRNANFFGFIDHDIYPIKPTKVINKLQDNYLYGLIQERENLWYLWSGFCFFNNDLINNKNINFMPIKTADTGSGNWDSIYSTYDKRKIPELKHEYGILREGGDYQSDMFEYIGDWLHTFNASNWKKIKDKDSLVDELLNKY